MNIQYTEKKNIYRRAGRRTVFICKVDFRKISG